jgi:hypothetical protein
MEKATRKAALIAPNGIRAVLRCSFQCIHRSPDLLLSARKRVANVSLRYHPEILNGVDHGVSGAV